MAVVLERGIFDTTGTAGAAVHRFPCTTHFSEYVSSGTPTRSLTVQLVVHVVVVTSPSLGGLGLPLQAGRNTISHINNIWILHQRRYMKSVC
jgi:hypothetical protein